MKRSLLEEHYNQIDKTVKKTFGVDEPTPPIIDSKSFPNNISFTFNPQKPLESHIKINPSWYDREVGSSDRTPVDIEEIRWGLCEELSHFYHFMLNNSLFEEKVETPQSNRRLLEINNLIELVGRVGGAHKTNVLPPDYGEVLGFWKEIIHECEANSQEEFDTYLENNPDRVRDLFDFSERVWGIGLGDYLISSYDKIPDYLKLIRDLAKSQTFSEASSVIEERTNSDLAREFSVVEDLF